MKLRDDDKVWLKNEISGQIEVAIDDLKDSLNPRGARRIANFLREWGLVTGAVGIPLTLLGLLITVSIFAFNGISKNVAFQTHTEDRLTLIEGDLREIKAQLTKQSLETHAALPLADFKATLPDLGSSVAAARKQNLKIPPKVMDDLSKKLAASTDVDTRTFWPVAAAVITYRSSLLVGDIQNVELFPPCNGVADLDNSPNASAQAVGPDGKPIGPKTKIERIGVQDCYIELDGKRASRWDCKHCVVKYSGGPISLRDVHFENCLFVFNFPSQQPPDPSGERFGEILLSSNLNNVEIKSV
jgi:hypothetical protein